LGALRRAFFLAENFAVKGVSDILEGRENFRFSTPSL